MTLTGAAFLASLSFLGRAGTGYVLIGLVVVAGRRGGGVGRSRSPGWSWCRVGGSGGGWSCYQRHWQPAMTMCGLSAEYGDRQYLPAIKRVLSNRFADRVLVVLLAGQAPADFEKQTDALAHTFGARRCAVRVDRPGRVWLDFFRADALTDPIGALPIPTGAGLRRPGPRAARRPGWRGCCALLGTHVLIAGATGAGKGSVLWSIVRALANGIRERTVLLWGIDPKGGMELTFGRRMFDRLGFQDTASMLALLDDAVAFMKERQARLVGITRTHVPTVADPLLVLVVDELAALIAYTDRETKKRASDALQLLALARPGGRRGRGRRGAGPVQRHHRLPRPVPDPDRAAPGRGRPGRHGPGPGRPRARRGM